VQPADVGLGATVVAVVLRRVPRAIEGQDDPLHGEIPSQMRPRTGPTFGIARGSRARISHTLPDINHVVL
jgi:hypothetical protein